MSGQDDDLTSQLDAVAADFAAGDRVSASRDGGELGEAIAAGLIEATGGSLVSQHTPDADPHGIDIVSLDPDGGLRATEVKGVVGDWHQSQTSPTVDGRQMDRAWTAEGLEAIGINADRGAIGDDFDQVARDLAQVDMPGGTVAVYEVADDGRRGDDGPREIWSIADIAEATDAGIRDTHGEDGHDASESESASETDGDTDAGGTR